MRKKPLVMVVDDNIDVVRICKMLLRDYGFDVVTADCGDEASDLLESLQPDAVLSDICMPGGNGLKLRDVAAARNIPVVFMSGLKDSYSTALKNTPVVGKPFNDVELVGALKTAISQTKVVS